MEDLIFLSSRHAQTLGKRGKILRILIKKKTKPGAVGTLYRCENSRWCSRWFVKDYSERWYWSLSLKQHWPVGHRQPVVTGTGTLAADLLGLTWLGDGASVQFVVPIRQFVMCLKAFLNDICAPARCITPLMGRWERCHRKRGCLPKDSQQELHHNRMITVHLSLAFNLVAYQATIFCQNKNFHYPWFYFPQTVLCFMSFVEPVL